MRNIFTLFLFFFFSSFSVLVKAQNTAAPTIGSLTPSKGRVGTAVTIDGTGFNAVPGNNVVFFGTVRATVSRANAGSLTVTVPAGAAYGPVSVLNAGTGLTAYSSQFFLPTFLPNKDNTTTSDFAAPVQYAAASSYSATTGSVVKDLDGDGKPEVIMFNDRLSDKSLSVMQNTSTGGNIGFAARKEFRLRTNIVALDAADFDGDGNPDIITINDNSSADKISVLRNTSTTGNISFAAQQNFALPVDENLLAIDDMDGDGRLDVVVTSSGGAAIFVLRNVSTKGNINFAAVEPSAIEQPLHGIRSLAVGDLDGDGKSELTVVGTNVVTVLRNKSTAGVVKFEAPNDFNFNPVVQLDYPRGLVLADFNGDGKLDLSFLSFWGSDVFIMQNTSTNGNISFAERSVIRIMQSRTNVNAKTPLSVADFDGDGKPDLAGAVNYHPSVFVLKNTTVNSDSITFAGEAEYPLGTTNTSTETVTAGDVNRDGKPDLILCQDGIKILQNTRTFRQLDSSQVHVALEGNNAAVVTWNPEEHTWTDDASFVITRINKTAHTRTNITLAKDEFDKGNYTDEEIPFCNEITYALQVVPPAGAKVTAYSAVPSADNVVAVELGSVASLVASKGYFPDRVSLRWHSVGGFTNYAVYRSATGDSATAVQIATVASTSTAETDVLFDDAKATPGTYYTYYIRGVKECGGNTSRTWLLSSVGFRNPTGNLNGRVTFEDGSAVANAAVRLQSSDQAQLGRSVLLNGGYLKIDSLKTPFNDEAFTVEGWIKPTDAAPANQVIFSRDGQYELGFNEMGKLYFLYNGTALVSGDYKNPNQTFIHVAGIHRRDTLLIMVNDSVVAKAAFPYAASNNTQKELYLGRKATGNLYKGYLDEVRVWNRALDSLSVARDYTRVLTGNEAGLIAYWRLDETIAGQFYDASFKGDDYNQNDGIVVNSNLAQRSDMIPSPDFLSLKTYTDSTGNYLITGIPYVGSGTAYAIAPLLGTHQFDPGSVNRLFSSSSPQFTVDFKDKSAFNVSGTVVYHNTTVPVGGVQFKVDGKLVQRSDGTVVETATDGSFTIKVPVGVHDVQAVKNNHVFAGSGRVTDLHGNALNYQDGLSGIQLYDSTTVRLIGRVSGGAIQDTIPLGHSQSVNNLGSELKISLTLTSSSQYKLTTSGPLSVDVPHAVLSAQNGYNPNHKTKVEYKTDSICIYPDAETGEYAADLIPEKFIVANVEATGWSDMPGKNEILDLSNKFIAQTSKSVHKDSVVSAEGTWQFTQYPDSVFFNASRKFIKRVKPTLLINQRDFLKNVEQPYFGDSVYLSATLIGKADTVKLINGNQAGVQKYLFGHPVFSQGVRYKFLVKSFEEYPFYIQDGVVKQVNGKNLIYTVPTQDGVVRFTNKIKDGAAGIDTASLTSDGSALYEFEAGGPDLTVSGKKAFSATIKFGQGDEQSWNWLDQGTVMEAYVLGGQAKGTNFVTAGPQEILMVLRDPPGSKSYSYAEKGVTISESHSFGGSFDQQGDEQLTFLLGGKIKTWAGVAVGIISEVEIENTVGVKLHHEEHYTDSHTKVTSTTTLSRFQTSDDPSFVGAPADVFVGYSTNITYGQTDNLTVIKRSNFNSSTDVLVYPASLPQDPTNYVVAQRGGLNFGQNFTTAFAYPQKYIENTLIPNLLDIRNRTLLPKTTSADTAQLIANAKNKPVYVSSLDVGEAGFGQTRSETLNSYKIYFPPGYSRTSEDTIMVLNQWVDNWQEELRKNEEAKLKSADRVQNYSFHAGSPIEYSEQHNVDNSREKSWSVVLGTEVFGSVGGAFDGFGLRFEFNESFNGSFGGATVNDTLTNNTFGFYLGSNGSDDYFSVDVNRAADSSFVFRTKGGASACPYEGATATKYYTPLNQEIDAPTLRIEVPKIAVEKPVVNDVPASRPASFNLLLRNASETKADGYYTLTYVDNDSIRGATIAVDGTPIGGTGRTILVPYGETLTKVLTLSKGPNAMNYENLMIVLRSTCDASVADTVLISAHFIPSCSDINIKSPADKWVLNTSSPTQSDKRYLPITMDKFDVNNVLFDHIELQYKPKSTSTWITAMKFYSDTVKYNAAEEPKQKITNPQALNYNLVFDDAFFNDQEYDIRAVSYCSLGAANYVTTESNLVSGTKDTYAPRLFGSPQPANGVLGVNDEVRLNFNENIAAGLLTYSDFQVTGIKNGTQGNHSVSVRLDGQSDYLATEFDKNLAAKSITAEMWVLPASQQNATIFSHGNASESMEMALTVDNRIKVTVGDVSFTSERPFDYKPGEWAHVAMVYNATSKTVSAYYNFVQVMQNAPVKLYAGVGPFNFGRSLKNGSYFAGRMHEARVWADTITSFTLQVNSLTQFSGAENKLLAYYPMNEGKGEICFDKAHGSNAKLTGQWSTPPGKAREFNGNSSYLSLKTAHAPVTSAMDYTLELWFKADPSQQNATLASNGKGDGTDANNSLNLFALGFEEGKLTYRNNGLRIQAEGNDNFLDNKWHHVALAINHNAGNGQLLVDGELKKYFDAQKLSGIASASVYLGARVWQDSLNDQHIDNYFKGFIDEFKVWNSYLNQALVSTNSNTKLKGDEIGLLVYYPFEKYTTFQGITTLDSTLLDMKIDPLKAADTAVSVNTTASDEAAPIKGRGPVSNLQFDYVVNNDALIINLLEPKQAIDKTIVTFKVDRVYDLNGNKIVSPVTWTAYINRNQLKWADNELNLAKDVYAPLQFESYLVNSGGSVQRYRLDNLPSWLTASPSSGTIDPLGRQKITFTVNEGLNIGAYDELVFMRNDNNEAEALKINLKVNGKQPDWVVNPAAFKYNMNVYGKIRINKVFSANKEDKLAAFIHGKCVGVTQNTYNVQNDFWYAFLTVYSDSLQVDKLEFRIWQASTGKTYQGIPAAAIKFSNNAVYGTVQNPVVIDGADTIFQDIVLNQNWNWISFNVGSPGFGNVGTTLANGQWSSGDIVKNEELGFSQYSSTSGWAGYLKGFNNTSLFMLKVATAQALSVSGTAVDVAKTAVPLNGGRWNYISYLPQVNMTVKDALAGYNAADEDVIKSQSGFAMYDSRNGWVGNLTYLEPGKGYMLYRKALTDTTFFYPSLNGSLTNHPNGRIVNNEKNASVLNPLQTPVSGNYSSAENMTVVAVTGGDFALQASDNILVFAGGELRGKAKPVKNAAFNKDNYFFNIGGDKTQLLSFVVERGGELVAQSDAVVGFATNAVLGTVRQPYLLQFKKIGEGIVAYPNPFAGKVELQVNLESNGSPVAHEVQLAVYDVSGKLVFSKGKETAVGTNYKTGWNGKTQANKPCASGVYFINLLIDGKPNIYKVIKL